MNNSLWTQKGESLSHKNACKEFGLEEGDIIAAIKAGKLQYKINYLHGNPYYKLLRQEVKCLVIKLYGEGYFKRQEYEVKIKKATSDINAHKRKIKALEKERALLVENLNALENK